MGKVRRFYGHEGIVPPLGFRSHAAAAIASEAPVDEADVLVADSLEGEPVELVGEVIEEGDEGGAAGSATRVDGSEVEVGEDGIPVLSDADLIEDGDEVEAAEVEADAEAADVDAAVPDDSWSGPELDGYAEEHGIDLTGAKKTKATKLARILESLES